MLRPRGQLRFFEHVWAESAALRRVQTLLDATVWPTLAGGCHAGRGTAAAIESAGFAIDDDRVNLSSSAGRRSATPATTLTGAGARAAFSRASRHGYASGSTASTVVTPW